METLHFDQAVSGEIVRESFAQVQPNIHSDKNNHDIDEIGICVTLFIILNFLQSEH